jgi:hypothetical protein
MKEKMYCRHDEIVPTTAVNGIKRNKTERNGARQSRNEKQPLIFFVGMFLQKANNDVLLSLLMILVDGRVVVVVVGCDSMGEVD